MLNMNIFKYHSDYLGYDFSEAEVLTENVLNTVEKKFGVKLPKEYIELMKVKNGGRLSYQYNTYYFEYTNPHDGEQYRSDINISDLRGITLDEIGIGCTFEIIEEWEYPEGIIILLHEGYYCVCLDYRDYSGDNPPISYIDLEVEVDVIIADSFEEFINNLTVEIEEEEEEEEEDDDDQEDEELRTFDRNEFEILLEKNQDEDDIVDGIYYFLNNAGDSEWFIKQLKKIINNKNISIVEVGICTLISLLKHYQNTKNLYMLKGDIEEIAQVVYDSEEYDINKYSIRLKSYIENYI